MSNSQLIARMWMLRKRLPDNELLDAVLKEIEQRLCPKPPTERMTFYDKDAG